MSSINLDYERKTFARELRLGLEKQRKEIPSKYFYDPIGARLFEEITHQPEYYLTRVETDLLSQALPKLMRSLNNTLQLVEFGSGNSTKTNTLIKKFLQFGNNLHYIPIDISKDILLTTADRLLKRYKKLKVTPVISQYETGLQDAKSNGNISPTDKMLIMFLGSSIGNMNQELTQNFMKELRVYMAEKDSLLIGFDLQKDPAMLNAAYNDSAGITERFNLNILARINRELGGEFNLQSFKHHAFYDTIKQRVEMHLCSKEPQEVHIAACKKSFHFQHSETIKTENCYKYTREQILNLATSTDFHVSQFITDTKKWFALVLFEPC